LFFAHPRSQILFFSPSRIPDPGVKKAPDPGSGSATLDSGGCLTASVAAANFGGGFAEGDTLALLMSAVALQTLLLVFAGAVEILMVD
jgi:hypothetical protein